MLNILLAFPTSAEILGSCYLSLQFDCMVVYFLCTFSSRRVLIKVFLLSARELERERERERERESEREREDSPMPTILWY
jgi:hypothetical protein